jgi:hypothetical protein
MSLFRGQHQTVARHGERLLDRPHGFAGMRLDVSGEPAHQGLDLARGAPLPGATASGPRLLSRPEGPVSERLASPGLRARRRHRGGSRCGLTLRGLPGPPPWRRSSQAPPGSFGGGKGFDAGRGPSWALGMTRPLTSVQQRSSTRTVNANPPRRVIACNHPIKSSNHVGFTRFRWHGGVACP